MMTFEPAQVLDEAVPADAERLTELQAGGVTRLNTEADQRRGLRELLPRTPSELLDEPARWVYYPWLHTLVRVLGPNGFRALRTDRNRNKITRDEQLRLGRQKVGVVGLSVGHAIAHTLALEGICGELRLADFDRIELSNLNRIPGSVLDLGINKAVVTARRIAELDPYLPVVVLQEGLTEEGLDAFVAGLDIVVEECDSIDMKLLVRGAARRHRVPLIMETSDRGLLDIERYDLEPGRPLFHGLLGDTPPVALKGLSMHDKVPYVLRILEPDLLSDRMAASMAEVDETVHTWPQLGSDVMLGAATVSSAVCRIGLGGPLPSGRVRVDLNSLLDRIEEPRIGGRAEPEVTDTEVTDDTDDTDDTSRALPADPKLRDIAETAHRAPSGGNTQPWYFTFGPDRFDIRLALEMTSTMDVAFRGSLVAVGAALFNARVAAARHGLLGPYSVHTGGAASDIEVSLHLQQAGDGQPDDGGLADRYDGVHARITNRHLGRRGILEADVESRLRGRASEYGAGLAVVTDPGALQEVAELLGESDRLRYLTPDLHEEMMRELRWPGRDTLDWGLDVRSLELDESDLAKVAVARRTDVMARLADWGVGRALGESTRQRVQASTAVLVLTARDTSTAGWVDAGQAVESVWVQAEADGLAVQPVSPVFLFACADDDFETLSARYADDLRGLARRFREVVGCPDQPMALVLRLTESQRPPSVPSRRMPLARVLRVADRVRP